MDVPLLYLFQVKRIRGLVEEIGLGNEANRKQQEIQKRLTKMITTIVLVFIICNSFESVIFILSSLNLIELDLVQNYLRPLADFLMVINSSVNVVIYCSFSSDFRNKFYNTYIEYFLQKSRPKGTETIQENISMHQIQTESSGLMNSKKISHSLHR